MLNFFSPQLFRLIPLYDNYLIANKKGLLLVEQPLVFSGVNPVCSP